MGFARAEATPAGATDDRAGDDAGTLPLPSEVTRALRGLGFEAIASRLVSPLGAAKGRRCAWRVEDRHGRVAKARLFEDEDAAKNVCDLREGLERSFAAVIGREGRVLVEEWVEGRPVAAFEADATLAWAAALLARLHARPLPAREPASVDVSPWLEGARADVARLAGAGLVSGRDAESGFRALAALAPSRARSALVHLDLSLENLVVHRAAGPRVIDNEMLAVRPPGFDLARSFHLWPMSEHAWRRFLEVYRSAGGDEIEALDFWRLVALALGTRIFFERAPARRDDAVARLLELLGRLAPVPGRPPTDPTRGLS